RAPASRDQWQQRQRQLSSYDTLAQRRAAQARHQEQRREQRASDETNNNAVARRPR
ncbi:flagellar FliJ family protein, partial [Alloalcanivorax marinus]|uniref:flagellar FliJ family protein n=1 Tax=Alloalcanivorax marinus TaxID=1177169 RepID=UPI003742AE2E